MTIDEMRKASDFELFKGVMESWSNRQVVVKADDSGPITLTWTIRTEMDTKQAKEWLKQIMKEEANG